MAPLQDVSNSTSSAPQQEALTKKKSKKSKKNKEVLSTESRILERLTRAVKDATPQMNRSPELVPLTVEWEATKKKLRLLVSLANEYAEHMRTMNESKSKLVSHMALLSENSPIFESVGENTLNGKSTRALESIRGDPEVGKKTTITQIIKSSNDSVHSVGSLQQMASAQALIQDRDFRAYVIDYATEWEKAVSKKVENELKKVRALQATRSHYESKVEKLREFAEELETKGKKNPPTQVERLARNETKLLEAFECHEKEAGRLCVLIEQATSDGWKDLYHLMKYYCKWESFRVEQESEIVSEHLPAALESMKAAFKEHQTTLSSKKTQEEDSS
mmetsp:Transcript_11396/g.32822  ORF Transcript_11396/g.32822 Transcript_11396/m.32822 type:complete len:334 (+) Transcript_11396:136-1137(+)|eukprot:CAMPEP_0172367522 /NCGR_PEP_ID=MMETSP1060-20121228/21855_1 /TAXON_ID=37318 /ORGANISM="Pseudo-nitzschia pungens, Strain cf. cingulata" /LENGTH=333 /DNA_ID=CAMNT_0013091799 /DNA_START=130 /DNA_END=1131 /DNA_ORIENTATION=-